MSVYTSVSETELQAFLNQFDCGELVSYRGIESGVENTNYFVTTSTGEFVLTLFEELNSSELETILNFADHLDKQGILVPAPIANKHGQLMQELKNKPTVLCPRLAGEHVAQPTAEHCYTIGKALAGFHLAAESFEERKVDEYGFAWWQLEGPTLTANLPEEEQALLHTELNYQTQHLSLWQALPKGWIHGDLFHDNALFNHDQGAILDLYAACEGTWLYDLAVVANDWCCDVNGYWLDDNVERLKAGYNSVRQITDTEESAWGTMLRAAALRFWLGRLETQQLQASYQGELALQKSPEEYRLKLVMRQQEFPL